MRGILIRVCNFEKYKGRKDVEHNSWFRCSNRLLEDPDFFEFSHEEILVWIYVLSLASQKNSDTVFINLDHAERVCRLKKKSVLTAIEKLKGNQIDPVDDTSTLRERDADDTSTCATDRQTDKTDKTDIVREPGGSLHPVGLVWNEIIQSLPKIRGWSENRTRLAKSLLVKRSIEEWSEACRKVEASDFLSGRSGKWTSCSFDWLIKPANLTKVLEGNYDNRQGSGAQGFGGKIEDILAAEEQRGAS